MRLIKLKEVLHITGLSRSTVYRLMSAGGFPMKVELGGNSVAWVESEVEEWISKKIGKRDTASAAA
ncbi:helix-turn-helix transcriptional regulator [Pseudoalteromonas sp. 2CM36K]|uniref:helix-turn-helix transcriptional regulator n=1 Tax=Pseudoalteromonas sp. 2CM36K TaxID=2929854 RepID=UPI0020C10173|nr:AlpA family transcriptional regulator [Pseudoalteromonas sp. 2CM36K]MCK8104740.1 AlpA family transcriptional regulator [Pseudoalteromonas sp. 2CM36K]